MPDYASRRCPRVDAPVSRYCARSFVAIVLGALCLAPGVGWARPGDPFGPDDTGCAPATRDELHCESALTGALSRLVAQMTQGAAGVGIVLVVRQHTGSLPLAGLSPKRHTLSGG